MEERTSWAVRTVDLRVAIQAAAVDRKSRHRIARIGRMEVCCIVAALAQPRPRDHQQVLVDGAVRIMTVQAVLAHGQVLEQKRPALLGVALVASVIDRSRSQHFIGEAAVRIMTVRTHHFAFARRHVRRAKQLRAPILVALEAGVGFKRRFQLELARHCFHNGMTSGAGETTRLVRASVPIGPVAALMAAEANCVVPCRCAARIFLAERDDATNPASAAEPHVLRAGSVAGLALQFALLLQPAHESMAE